MPNFSIGSIIDGILNNDDCDQQNSERNVVDPLRKMSIVYDEERERIKDT